jgi:sortase A
VTHDNGPGSLGRMVRWTQAMLFGVALSMLGYVGFVIIDTWLFQQEELRHLREMVTERQKETPQLVPDSPKRQPPVNLEGLIGLIEIPRLGLSSIVVEGTTDRVLRRAVGHISGTALPGEEGNVGLSGHRDTFFRQLRNIQLEDRITLTTPQGGYQYTVVSTQIVDPSDVTVLDPDGESELLTLVTCYPFSYVGPAPQRFIVRAEKVDLAPRPKS